MAIKIDFEKTINKNLNKLENKLGAAVLMYCATWAETLEGKMKVNRPWTDRTGMAKATLNAKVTQPDKNLVRILLSHGVNYGIWLELANEKKYAIIQPTIQEYSPRVVEGLQGLMGKIKL